MLRRYGTRYWPTASVVMKSSTRSFVLPRCVCQPPLTKVQP